MTRHVHHLDGDIYNNDPANLRIVDAAENNPDRPKPTMPPATLTALQGSILKWQAIVDGTGVDNGSGNCPLCYMFLHGQNSFCLGCPVMQETGNTLCLGSPYDTWLEVTNDDGQCATTPERKAAA